MPSHDCALHALRSGHALARDDAAEQRSTPFDLSAHRKRPNDRDELILAISRLLWSDSCLRTLWN